MTDAHERMLPPWNGLRGEMSLIGPRPEQYQFVRQLLGEIPTFEKRLIIAAGFGAR